MNKKELSTITRKIESLPKGTITTKRINGREYEYWQYREDGKQITKRVKGTELEFLQQGIAERKRLEQLLKTDGRVDHQIPAVITPAQSEEYSSFVRIGEELRAFSEPVRSFKMRGCFDILEKYLYGPVIDKVLILYGLRRTGKTTMIRQAICRMDETALFRTAFIQVKAGDGIKDINKDLRALEKKHIKYVFIDEVTLLEDFIENAALLSDIFAASGMKIVLSGTDSLGFVFSQDDQLYDRAIMIHTTFIPYREFEGVLGEKGIDEYIRYGGTMCLGGNDYNQAINPFETVKSTNEYIDSAIANNIQHSLKNYQYSGHFRNLQTLYEKGELTNVINRIVEDMNHRFVLEVIRNAFVSHDLGISRNNLRSDKSAPTDILDDVDTQTVTSRLMDLLEIRNAVYNEKEFNEVHLKEIKEYFTLLELIENIEVVSSSDADTANERIAFTQAGLRFSQAEALIVSLMQDSVFRDIHIRERMRITDRILDEIRGRMMEDIILLETKKALPDQKVFVLQFPVGEFDMVLFDPKSITCRLYEIKHSSLRDPKQVRHLTDTQKLEYVSMQYGDIAGRYVIYSGEGDRGGNDGEVQYLNVEEYLKGLYNI
ncbi:AAA family ATPase [Butyrivibrio sp. FCS014]|uniref:AAA family ATPase n=1 Tax=Butyrivibrio sp. FCS014 TaxID=1408304 RepID=UPI000464F778|nr:AAA family ATPase [Butyrivibrio sp. FCS014]